MVLNLPYNFEPYEYQEPLLDCFDNGYKRAVAEWHRKAGKDLVAWNITIRESQVRVGAYYYFLPTLVQGRDTIWKGMTEDGTSFLDYVPKELLKKKPNDMYMELEFKNGSMIKIQGSDTFKKKVGPNPVGVVYSEYSLQDYEGWLYMMPILANNGGWAIFLYTPRGRNIGYDMMKMAKKNKDWFYESLTVNDTGKVSKEAIDEARRAGMDEALIQQEFYCSYEASNPGAYFVDEMFNATQQGRIMNISVEPGIPVNTSWDLGMDGYTVIWLSQLIGNEVRFPAVYYNRMKPLAHYAEWLKQWAAEHNATFGEHYLPHDVKVTELTTGKSRYEVLLDLGIDCIPVKAPKAKEDGIEAVRQLLPKCWFDEMNCEDGIEGLKQFRREVSRIKGVISVQPVKDSAMHFADALQTLALNYQVNVPKLTFKKEYVDKFLKPKVKINSEVSENAWMG